MKRREETTLQSCFFGGMEEGYTRLTWAKAEIGKAMN